MQINNHLSEHDSSLPDPLCRLKEWQRKRGKLHHDEMQNKFTLFLSSQSRELERLEQPINTPDENILRQLKCWQKYALQIADLLDDAVYSFSPRRLLEQPPLSQSPLWVREYLWEIGHALFLQRSGIPEKINAAKNALHTIDNKYKLLLNAVCGSGQTVRDKTRTAAFRASLDKLSEAISAIPHEIVIR